MIYHLIRHLPSAQSITFTLFSWEIIQYGKMPPPCSSTRHTQELRPGGKVRVITGCSTCRYGPSMVFGGYETYNDFNLGSGGSGVTKRSHTVHVVLRQDGNVTVTSISQSPGLSIVKLPRKQEMIMELPRAVVPAVNSLYRLLMMSSSYKHLSSL